MTANELNASLATAHLIGHIQFFIKEAEAKKDNHTIKLHLKAIIRACEINPELNYLIEEYKLKLKSYE